MPKSRAKNIEVVLVWSFFGADGRHTLWQALFFHLSSWGSSKLTSSSSNINMRRHGKSSSENCLSNQSLKHCLSIRASFPEWNHVFWCFLHSFLIQLYTFFNLKYMGTICDWMLPQRAILTKGLIDLESSYRQCQCKDSHDTKNTTTWMPWRNFLFTQWIQWIPN